MTTDELIQELEQRLLKTCKKYHLELEWKAHKTVAEFTVWRPLSELCPDLPRELEEPGTTLHFGAKNIKGYSREFNAAYGLIKMDEWIVQEYGDGAEWIRQEYSDTW